MGARRLLIALIIAVPVVWTYVHQLGDAPIYLHHDEALVAMNAHAIATTGRDPHGERTPLFFHVVGDLWQTPISIYSTALVFKFLPISETTIRLPSVIVGLLTVVLMYWTARKVFASEPLAFIAASFLALTPAMFIHSRLGFDHHYPALFVTAWLLGLATFLNRPRLRTLFLSTLTLGAGVYSYLASLLMMPVYFGLTCILLFEQHRRSPRVWIVAAAGFALPLTLLLFWMATHPSQYSQNINMYRLYDATKLNPLQGLHEMLSYTSLTARSSVYYTSFDPSFLFFGGDTSLVHSTRRAGVFLFAVGAFLVFGLYRILTERPPSSFHRLLVAGFVVAPLAAAVVAESYRVSRQLVMLPFAILIATFGVQSSWNAPNRAWRLVTVCLLALVPLQFVLFYRDYMTDYRGRSAGWFEGNIRGAMEAVIEHEPAGSPRPVYVGSDIAWADSYWSVYALKHGRSDLMPLVRYYDPKTIDATAMPEGSFLITRNGGGQATALAKAGGLQTVALLREPDDSVSFAVLERCATCPPSGAPSAK